MAKPQFSNLPCELWVHKGRIGVARTNLCLFHEVAENGSPILDALDELRVANRPAQRLITLAPCSRRRSLTSLRLVMVAERNDLRVMNIRHDGSIGTIEMTAEGLDLLVYAFTAWLHGGEDFGVAPDYSDRKPKDLGQLDLDSSELWFWGPGYDGP